MDLKSYRALTFDCYGTLIDWESGILQALRPLLAGHGVALDGEAILEHYARYESEAQRGDSRPYRDVLRIVVQRFAGEFGFASALPEQEILANSLADWPPFPDTVAALQALSHYYRLAIVSNIDDDLFARTASRLQVAFNPVVTAEQVRSYKPARRHFEVALERLDLPREQVLHVAQSLYHDIAPANALGLATVWVNRRQGKSGFGATVPATAQPNLEVPDLATLAALAREGR